MPPPRRRAYGCQKCCIIWFPVVHGLLVMGCAHCPKIASKREVAGDEDLMQRLVAGSHNGHKVICGRPIR